MAKQYGWKDVSVIVLGRTIEGITDIKVKRKTAKERQYGRGSNTQNILHGNEEISGSITLLQDELAAINTAVKAVNPALNINGVSFDVIINYEKDNGEAATDAVIGVSIEEYEKALSQGDTHMKIELPFMAVSFNEDI